MIKVEIKYKIKVPKERQFNRLERFKTHSKLEPFLLRMRRLYLIKDLKVYKNNKLIFSETNE